MLNANGILNRKPSACATTAADSCSGGGDHRGADCPSGETSPDSHESVGYERSNGKNAGGEKLCIILDESCFVPIIHYIRSILFKIYYYGPEKQQNLLVPPPIGADVIAPAASSSPAAAITFIGAAAAAHTFTALASRSIVFLKCDRNCACKQSSDLIVLRQRKWRILFLGDLLGFL